MWNLPVFSLSWWMQFFTPLIKKEVIDGGYSYTKDADRYNLGYSGEKFVYHYKNGSKRVLFYNGGQGTSTPTAVILNYKLQCVGWYSFIYETELRLLELNLKMSKLYGWIDSRTLAK